MTQHDTDPLHGRAARTRHGEPRLAAAPAPAPDTGDPFRPGPHRRGRRPAQALLALSVAMLVAGMILPQGLLLATGLVTVGMATYLLVPPYDRDRLDLPLSGPVHLSGPVRDSRPGTACP
ncbi:hypothetical protein SUDANB120_06040 [Streptomyces sp. enrichment culture]|uniref:DUF3040 domain-containing protein n=1 Tax=Streptomyces sp. enrichment culture TaxID=1795815 RepID=UPI003F54805F